MSQALLSVVQRLANDVRALALRTPSAPTWATVTSVNPLKVRPDTSFDGSEISDLENAAGMLRVGARVVIAHHNKRNWLYGPADAAKATTWADVPLPSGTIPRVDGAEPPANSRFRPQVKIHAGMVHLIAQLDPSSVTTGTTTTLFTLPEQYWPEHERRWQGFATNQGHSPFGGYISSATGEVIIQTPATRTPQYPTAHFSIIVPPWPAK